MGELKREMTGAVTVEIYEPTSYTPACDICEDTTKADRLRFSVAAGPTETTIDVCFPCLKELGIVRQEGGAA